MYRHRDAPSSRFVRRLTKKRQEVLFQHILVACDVAILVASYAAAYRIRAHLLPIRFGHLSSIVGYEWILWVILPTWLFLLDRFDLNESASYGSLHPIIVSLLKVQLLGALVLTSVMYLSHSTEVSRLLLNIFLGTSYAGLVIEKSSVRLLLAYLRGADHLRFRQVLVIGTGVRADRYVRLLGTYPHWRADIMGFLSTSGYDGADYCNKPVLGHLWQLREILQSHVVDEVMITTSIGDAVAEWVIDTCKEKGITVRFAVEIPPAGNNFKYYVETVGIGRFLLSLEAVPQDIVPLLIKRSIDVIGASVGLVLCAITYIWYAPLMRRESPGPVLFRQTRVGQNGRQFTLYKFRTMYLDAEEKLPTLQSRNEMRGSIFKMKNDPRVTSAGRTLRRRHLDELPQFWNVLLGEISLVGTRPPTPKEVSQYEYHQYRRLSMRPGLTGLWQLKGNGAISDFEDIVKLDCDYIDNWSLWLDCKILAKTVMKVARGDAW